jgi:POLQ-like helicase
MKPEFKSKTLLGVTRSKAKMYEYDVPVSQHIRITRDPNELFTLTIGMLGDFAAKIINNEVDYGTLKEQQKDLLFSAHFFDTLNESKLQVALEDYLLLMGSASYFLCDLPGSSNVLVNRIKDDKLNLQCNALDFLLYRILKADYEGPLIFNESIYERPLFEIIHYLNNFVTNGEYQNDLLDTVDRLRKYVYNNNLPRELLFVDVISAVIMKRLKDSVWNSLPEFTGLSVKDWSSVFRKRSFIKELWPAQRLLGENGVYNGQSAVVQMPTSAGKTKSIEIIIRSAFLTNRTSLAVIVAPFKSLCNEITNELVDIFSEEAISVDQLSDVLSIDFNLGELLGENQVLVVTPEKLLYILRRSPELGEKIGLLIYDEGHQFDNGKRGITYELLLASLKNVVPETVQTILISAVISNADEIGKWLNGEEGKVISGTYLTPTYKTIAFASWVDQLGRLEFVDFKNPENNEFYVPRIIEETKLNLKGNETKERFFPDKNNGSSIASFLGLKLISNGSVAIFCGTKIIATSVCKLIIDAFDRGINLLKPIEYSNPIEVNKLYYLYKKNLGLDSEETKAAEAGIFAHHSNIPNGIRLAVEHAMRENLIKFVICTSTLAQGVNLPIRYLILTNPYQGTEQLKVRDFHNLIGRVARSGIHTEGSIIFADPKIYDQRNNQSQNWRWKKVKDLLEENKSEPCISTLDSLFEPLKSDNGRYDIQMDPLAILSMYVDDKKRFNNLANELEQDNLMLGVTKSELEKQINWRLNIIQSIESYLMSFMDDTIEISDQEIIILATSTLAHFIGDERQRQHIEKLFKLLLNNIKENVKDKKKRTLFGKSLFGVDISLDIEEWTHNNIEDIKLCESYECLIKKMWPIISKYINNNSFKKIDNKEILLDLLISWSRGLSYKELFDIASSTGAKLQSVKQTRNINLGHVIEICEKAFSFEASLIISAVTDTIEFIKPQEEIIIESLKILQKKVKYGLPSKSSISFYELGFADRVISQDLSHNLQVKFSTRKILIRTLKRRHKDLTRILEKYPSYYQSVMSNIL